MWERLKHWLLAAIIRRPSASGIARWVASGLVAAALCLWVLRRPAAWLLVTAVVAYPVTLVSVWTWRAWRARHRLRRGPRRLSPLELGRIRPLIRQEALARYTRKPERFLRAAGVELLVDGAQAFGPMLAAIDAAVQSVDLETYILADDDTGRRFQQALCRAARRGVPVRVLYDYVGSLHLSGSFVRELLSAGAAVAVYSPPLLWLTGWRVLNHRNHRKTLIVDGTVTFTGGLNIADDYAAVADGGRGWRDTHVRIDGAELADQATLMFDYAWRQAAPYGPRRRLRTAFRRLLGRNRPERQEDDGDDDGDRPPRPDPAGVPVQLLGNREFGNRHRIYQAYLHAIRHARQYVLIENAYFVPDRRMRRELARAVRRGVRVAVAVAHNSDVQIVAWASRYLYGRLLAAGVRLFEWPEGMLHAKTAIIDDAWALVGSYNFDHRSLFDQLESAAIVVDANFARRLREQTLADLARCREVVLEEHEGRPVYRMVLESAAHLIRHWL